MGEKQEAKSLAKNNTFLLNFMREIETLSRHLFSGVVLIVTEAWVLLLSLYIHFTHATCLIHSWTSAIAFSPFTG